MWLELASHLHKTLQEVKQQTTSTEFLLWVEYLKLKRKEPRREDYYLAQIAAEVCKARAKYPDKVKLTDFILKFSVEKKKKKKMSIKKKIEASKRFWFSKLGLNYKKECGKKE